GLLFAVRPCGPAQKPPRHSGTPHAYELTNEPTRPRRFLMALFNFGSTSPRRRLVLTGIVLLAFTAPAAHGQGRALRPRPFVMPSRTPSMMQSRTPSMMAAQTN